MFVFAPVSRDNAPQMFIRCSRGLTARRQSAVPARPGCPVPNVGDRLSRDPGTIQTSCQRHAGYFRREWPSAAPHTDAVAMRSSSALHSAVFKTLCANITHHRADAAFDTASWARWPARGARLAPCATWGVSRYALDIRGACSDHEHVGGVVATARHWSPRLACFELDVLRSPPLPRGVATGPCWRSELTAL